MNIDKMSLEEINFELKRAKFWIEENSIKKSLKLINKMENRKFKIINKELNK